MNLGLSESAAKQLAQLKEFISTRVLPIEAEIFEQRHKADNPWVELPQISELKQAARQQGLWNLFFPDTTYGTGLTNTEYAYFAESMGQSLIAPEIFNCNAPDTGNMEVLIHYGSESQKQQWLPKLLDGSIRSAFCMTEPAVASSDATNMQATAIIEGDEVVLNGRKWWSTGIGHPNCEMLIFMGVTDAKADRHHRHSMVIVPKSAPGVKVERMLSVFGDYDEPYGHGEVTFNNVRLPLSNIIAGPGRGFEIAQGRLGPGRIHHCMRALGAAERVLGLMLDRAKSRVAFGKPLHQLGGNGDIIANARISIEQARLLTLKAAWMLDSYGVKQAMSEVSQIKVIAPNVLQTIVDQAIQIYGGGGLSSDFPLAGFYGYARCLRLADGPDEVHRALIAKIEIKKHD